MVSPTPMVPVVSQLPSSPISHLPRPTAPCGHLAESPNPSNPKSKENSRDLQFISQIYNSKSSTPKMPTQRTQNSIDINTSCTPRLDRCALQYSIIYLWSPQLLSAPRTMWFRLIILFYRLVFSSQFMDVSLGFRHNHFLITYPNMATWQFWRPLWDEWMSTLK